MKLRNNHARVLKDVCNPSKDKNMGGKPLTQLNLVRVDPKDEALADEALCEIERRLLDEGWSDAPNEEARRVWKAVATYLDGRIQSTPGEKVGRKPDMSPAAATAMRAVLQQLASGTKWQADAGIAAMAAKMGVPAPPAGPWLQMLCEVIERIPFAMLVTDVCVPGLPITYCNAAMAKLTGYQRSEIEGRNCRFLQGPLTEASAVRQMIVAIRTAEPTTVRVTNYHVTAQRSATWSPSLP